MSSPVDGFDDFRYEIISAARSADASGKFQFFYFEQTENPRLPGMTICESIFESTGNAFDAFFIFFRDRVGAGTIEEFDYFERHLLQVNANCQLWWTKVYSANNQAGVNELLARLHNYNTGLAAVPGEEKNSSERVLKGRFVAKLFQTVVSLPV